MAGALSSWPWESLGAYKYYMLGPFVGNVIYSRMQEGVIKESWCLHIIILWAIRIYMYHLWTHYVSMLFFTRNRIIDERGVDFDQIDREWDWDNFMLLQAIMGAIACNIFPFISNVPLWDSRGFIVALLLHMALSEPIYYYVHKCFHGRYLFKHYHSIHHSSTLPQPYTAGYGSFLEHIILCGIIGIPIIGTCFMGYGSKTMIYGYLLLFDFMRSLGHSNVEIIPHQLYEALPFMRYLLYTPTYHSLHHTEKATNYCLFMPLYDALGNTLNTNSWELHKKMSLKSGKNSRVPDFVFLAHAVDITTSLHSPSSLRGFASMPFKMRWFLIVVWPLGFIVMLIMWAKSKVFLYSFYNLRGRLHQTWVVPRYGFQYFLPFCKKGINMQIEEAILRADRLGVKVLSLAALNKNEALNGGGTLFVEKYPDLKVRVVHGNTLTAAVILNEITDDVEEVFLTGATSKLGRAIALYLCKKRVRVLMLTVSTERFEKIKKEAPIEYQKYLVQVTKYQAAQNCKTWIVGKWITPREQSWAPSGTQFHQFVVPPIFSFRSDCTYGDLAAMRLPDDVQGLGCCEYTLERGVVHACHAGGVVHFLEGWTHHEVGAIDVAQIDIVWAAALKHGLKPVSSFPKHKRM